MTLGTGAGNALYRFLFRNGKPGGVMENREAVRLTKRVTAAILAVSFAYAFVNSLTSVLVNEIIDAFSLAGAAQGLLSSMLSMGLMLALLATPALQGRIQKMTMVLLSGLLQAAMLLLSGAAPAFAFFAPAIVLLGVGCGWLDTYINSCMVDVHPTDSPKYLGLLHGIFGIGSLLAPLAIQWLLLSMRWRGVHFAVAGLTLLAMLLIALVRRDIRAAGGLAQTQEARLSFRQLGVYLKGGRNLLLLGCGAVTSMVQTGVLCWIARYMLVEHNAAALGASCLTIFWVAATVNRFLAPRLRVKPLVMVALGSLLCGLFLLAGIWSGSAAVMCVAVGLVGLASGHFQPMLISECAAGYRGNTTLTTSALMIAMGLGRVAVPLVMAAISDAVSMQAGMSVPVAAAMLSLLLSLCALRVKPAAD